MSRNLDLHQVGADIVQSLVLGFVPSQAIVRLFNLLVAPTYIETARDIRVLYQVVSGQQSVVRLNNSIRNLGTGDDGKGRHHSVRVLFPDLAQKQGSETGSSTSSKRMEQLESLQTVGVFGLLTDVVQHFVDKLGTFMYVREDNFSTEKRVVWSLISGLPSV